MHTILSRAAVALAVCCSACLENQAAALDADAADISAAATADSQVTRHVPGTSNAGGELVAYFAGNQVQKLVATYGGEVGRAQHTVYYRAGVPFLVVVAEEKYDQPRSGRVASRAVERLYFTGRHVLRSVDGSWVRRVDDRRAHAHVDSIAATVRTLFELASSP